MQSYFYFSSNLAQHVLEHIINDEKFIQHFLETNHKNLRNARNALEETLKQYNIPFVPSHAGFFLLLNLSQFLPEATWEAEDAFWKRLIDECQVVS
jgi:aspartate/methionine/tyrosine aminotransferase